MTTRLASLPAPEGLRPARSGAAERSPAETTRLASLPAPEGCVWTCDSPVGWRSPHARPARSGAAERSPASE
jgi:hypothetical protein